MSDTTTPREDIIYVPIDWKAVERERTFRAIKRALEAA